MSASWRRGMSANFGQNRKLQQAKCDDFNAKYPLGTSVDLLLDNRDVLRTVTRSGAQVLEGHSAVIWLRGVAGCYLLSRVTPVELTAGKVDVGAGHDCKDYDLGNRS
jgi:hypothetical protein